MRAEETAWAQHLMLCHVCGLLVRSPANHDHVKCLCPRCQAPLHARKPDSLQRTRWLMFAAYFLLLPANLLPIMRTETLGGMQQDTIISGVIYLWQHGAWPLSLIVFIASVAVPLAKLGTLTVLVRAVGSPGRWSPGQLTRMYRVIEFVGRWSMLDIFVVTVLAALVRLQVLATIEPGPGAAAFGGVVVLTMLATRAFDPRLIWDNAPNSR
ncbi:MAG: paraquat-inducible protein A [Rhodocyclaceae bacterium]|jgi:paraquat-inducible protein A|nr:paraquat-inducible protein A [Rhodocyclaceae bacterium]MBK6908845.1 paraquat-inducible protein A [Rhodocyclaceae bacterium]